MPAHSRTSVVYENSAPGDRVATFASRPARYDTCTRCFVFREIIHGRPPYGLPVI